MTNYKALGISLNKRILVPETEVQNKLSELYEQDYSKDYYISVYNYTEEHKKQFDKTNSLSGMKDLTTSRLIFDFDSKTDLPKAKQDAVTVVDRLAASGFNKIQTYFSSNKGFHVEVSLTNEYTKPQIDAILEKYAGDLVTVDKQIHDYQRIIRAPLSKNPESGLFKIPLTTQQLKDLTVGQIKIKAKDVDDSSAELVGQWMTEKQALPIPVPVIEKKTKVSSVDYDDTPDFSKNKTGLTHAKYALACGFFEEGERHEATMILASTSKALGWPIKSAYRIVKGAIEQRNERLGLSGYDKSEIWREVENVYNDNWRGGTFDEKTNPLLIRTKKKYGIEDKFENNLMVNLSQVDNIFGDFAANIDKNTLKLGIPSFDHEIRVTTSTLVSLLAAPSAGKSSIAFGILNATSKDGINSMFFSLDMAAPQVYQRLAQRHTGFSSERLFTAYKTKDGAVIEKVKSTLGSEYKNVKFCFRGAMNVEIIRNALLKEKEMTGEFPKLVVIDYLENVMTDLSNDPTIAKGFVARTLKDMANEFAICILLLVQPAKVTGGPSEELNSYYNIKGSGLVAEASAQVITMHRPGFDPKNPDDDNFINLTVVKNRMGQLGSFDYNWDGVTGKIRELTEEEMKTLQQIRTQNKLEKEDLI